MYVFLYFITFNVIFKKLKVKFCVTVQDEEVSEFAVDALKDVSSETRQRQEGQEEEQVV